MTGRSRWRWIVRWLALGVVAGLAGCAAAPTAILVPTLSPRAEAVAYFPARPTWLAVVRTDQFDDGVRGLAQAGGLEPLRVAARRYGVLYSQVRWVLGHDLVLGQPRAGAAPLAVLVARDREELQMLVQSRVIGGRARVAGTYRGAELLVERSDAIAVRGAVLLVSRTTRDLRAALDTRAGDDSFDASELARALPPAAAGHEPLVRALVDLRPLLSPLGARVREVPFLLAAEEIGATVRVAGSQLVLDARMELARGSLVQRDLPLSSGARAPRQLAAPGAETISVRDLARLTGWAERTAASAFPLAFLRFEGIRDSLGRRSHVDFDRDVVRTLHGPATLVLAPGGLLLRAQPSRPADLEAVLARLARHAGPILARRHLRLARDERFYAIRRGRHTLVRIGVSNGALVAGRALPATLRALASAHLRRALGTRGPLTLTVPGARITSLLKRAGLPPVLPPWALIASLRGSPSELDLSARATLPTLK